MTNSNKRWLVGSLALLVVAAAALVATKGLRGAKSDVNAAEKKGAPPLEFTASDVVKLESHRLSAELVMPGSLAALSQATVRSKLSAEVRRVGVREGDKVVAGQIVAEFDTAQLNHQLAERKATLESARAQLAQTERTRQTNALLVEKSFISKNAYDSADDAYRAQAAAVEAAQAQLAQTQLQLKDAVVRAPIGGFVARRHVQPGEKVAFDAPLIQIVDLSQMEVQAQAPVADIAQLVSGTAAEVQIEGLSERRYQGRIDRINPAAEAGSRMIHVYVLLANEDSLLRAGMFARVRVQLNSDRERPTLPITAVRTERGQSFVWVISDGKLTRRMVSVGARDERAQRVEITAGLNGDERIIGSKFDNLREGMLAQVVNLGGATTAADPERAQTAAALRR